MMFFLFRLNERAAYLGRNGVRVYRYVHDTTGVGVHRAREAKTYCRVNWHWAKTVST